MVENINRLGGTLADLLNHGQHELLQVMDVRNIIEPQVTAQAALRARPMDLEELTGLLQQMSRKVSVTRFAELDRNFHHSIARATGNPLLVSLLERVSEIVDQSRQELLQNRGRRMTSLREHRAILDALYAGTQRRPKRPHTLI